MSRSSHIIIPAPARWPQEPPRDPLTVLRDRYAAALIGRLESYLATEGVLDEALMARIERVLGCSPPATPAPIQQDATSSPENASPNGK